MAWVYKQIQFEVDVYIYMSKCGSGDKIARDKNNR